MNAPKEILQIGNPILEQKTSPIDNILDQTTQDLVEKLLKIVLKYEDLSAGLAAPQIGHSKAICAVRRYDKEEVNENLPKNELFDILINPKIVKKGSKSTTFWEGCLSIGWGKDALFGPVKRPDEIEVEYLDTQGNPSKLIANDFFAHVVQHEIDHLNGILYLQYITNPDNIWRSEDLDRYYEKHKDYPEIA